ncbi:enoyl-CoA hydratase-related protein [Chitinophagales bacterium]|nr:enoyl-CoA hydratase-related protein [Chitinophagales bacterium]
MENPILFNVDNGVATLTLNRPDRYNAFTPEMMKEFVRCMKLARKDDEVRVVVLTGAGEKAFCSGQDVKANKDAAGTRSLGDSVRNFFNPMVRSIVEMEKPVVCRLNGVAAGAGCSLAIGSDIVVAADHARLIEVFVNIGLVLDSGSSFFLPRIVGSKRAFEMCSMAKRIDAATALEWGLVNKVVPMDQLDEAVKEYTDFYRTAPTKAIGMIKKMLNASSQSDLKSMLELEAQYQEVAGRSADHIEGVTAFNEKRKPTFTGM